MLSIIRATPYTHTDRVGGIVYDGIGTSPEHTILYYGIDPFTKDYSAYNIGSRYRIVSVSDLHHGHLPFQKCFAHVHKANTTGVIIPYNPRYALILRQMGLNCLPRSIDYGYVGSRGCMWSKRRTVLIHTGRLSPVHKRRIDFISKAKSEIPLLHHFNGDGMQTWTNMVESKYSLNLPLNADRNCRFWESMLAGCLLFQPKLPKLQWHDIGYSVKELFIEFYDLDDLKKKLEYYERHDDEAKEIANRASRFAWKAYMNRDISDLQLIKRLAFNPVGDMFTASNYEHYLPLYRWLDLHINSYPGL